MRGPFTFALLLAAGIASCSSFGASATPEAPAPGGDASVPEDASAREDVGVPEDADSGAALPDGSRGAYAAMVLAAKPVAYWRLGERAGATIAADAIEPGHPGTYVQPVVLGALGAIVNDLDTAINLTGGGVSFGDAFDFAGSAFSFEAWVKFAPLPAGAYTEAALISKMALGAPGWHVYVANNNTIGFDVVAANLEVKEMSGVMTGTAAAFQHVVVTYDGTHAIIYVNGSPRATKDLSVALPDTTHALSLGLEDGGKSTFMGVLDEVALYDRVLSSSEVTQHLTTGLTGY